MTEARLESLIAVAFAHTATVQAWRVSMSRREGERIEHTLCNLLDLGHVAGFSIRHISGDTMAEFVQQLRLRVGSVVLVACHETLEASIGPPPAFLMPVWGFDDAIGGLPAATGRLLGLDLKLIATPSPYEELGAHLSGGREGLWLIHAGPMF